MGYTVKSPMEFAAILLYSERIIVGLGFNRPLSSKPPSKIELPIHSFERDCRHGFRAVYLDSITTITSDFRYLKIIKP